MLRALLVVRVRTARLVLQLVVLLVLLLVLVVLVLLQLQRQATVACCPGEQRILVTLLGGELARETL